METKTVESMLADAREAGQRLFLWIGESDVDEWTVAVPAKDEDEAYRKCIAERMTSIVAESLCAEEAMARFEESDRLVDITDLVALAIEPYWGSLPDSDEE